MYHKNILHSKSNDNYITFYTHFVELKIISMNSILELYLIGRSEYLYYYKFSINGLSSKFITILRIKLGPFYHLNTNDGFYNLSFSSI